MFHVYVRKFEVTDIVENFLGTKHGGKCKLYLPRLDSCRWLPGQKIGL